ncbi:flagellar basal body-associated protein FliL [Paraglaciecola psychrophila]|uniref:Flagellar protein FliL n=1 Tax=Paraglaciecola psychrophila 170 TaxID=1129794 RepID=K7ASV0_9ALTE|nr:flagellar basal body-associated protein FliL [Paraglaciecola psychrophila]AGH45771.1 flagellar basal body-associated protein FliL [Paraglaciecola psychrophila 170]GAC38290.1 flagellar FliL protein [Paraglaciecola psychrophila 170]
MAEEELKMEEGGKKSKLVIIIIAVVVLIVGGGAAYYFLMADDDNAIPVVVGKPTVQGVEGVKTGTAMYVAMPRPFVFNVPGTNRDRLVEIKVQLMMRGSDNEEQSKMHIPLIEGTLLKIFSTANADDLATEAGKIAIRDSALKEVQKTMLVVSGNQTVEEVLFTGFVMQ